MSSASKTTNLQLNQWAATDPVLRTDFNSDNAKLDSVIGSINSAISTMQTSINAMPYRKLTEVTFSSTVTQVDVDLGVNLWDYSNISIISSLISSHPNRQDYRLTLGGNTTDYYQYSPTSGTTGSNTATGFTGTYAGGSNTAGGLQAVSLNISKPSFLSLGTIWQNSYSQSIQKDSNPSNDVRYARDSVFAFFSSPSVPIRTINFTVLNASYPFTKGKITVFGTKL